MSEQTQRSSEEKLVPDTSSSQSLAEKMLKMAKTGEKLAPVAALNLVAEIVAALHQFEDQSQTGIHPDLRPENILISKANKVALIKPAAPPRQPITAPKTAVTPQRELDFQAPEQLDGRPITAQSNIFSLGVILYELLAGQRPQLPESAWGKSFEREWIPQEVPLEEVQSGLTPATYGLVRECLRRQPWARYDTLTDMSKAINKAIKAEQRAVEKGAVGSEQNRRPLYLTTGIVLLVVILLAAFFLLRNRSSQSPSDGERLDTAVAEPTENQTPAANAAARLTPDAADLATASPQTSAISAAAGDPLTEESVSIANPTATATLPPTLTATSTPTFTPTPTARPIPEGMILVPAGSVLVGSPDGPANEAPEHRVSLDAFFIDQFEVSNSQYLNCVEVGNCTQANLRHSYTNTNYRNDPAYGDFPVIGISWNQANAYCLWIEKRLPTEAEWEYAASGPENFTWPWGNEFDATLSAASARDVQPVDSYPDGVSPFGIFNMSGNVVEWVQDVYDESFYANSPAANPVSSGDSNLRIYRGGSFGNSDGSSSTTSRRYIRERTFFDLDVGFRCAMDAP